MADPLPPIEVVQTPNVGKLVGQATDRLNSVLPNGLGWTHSNAANLALAIYAANKGIPTDPIAEGRAASVNVNASTLTALIDHARIEADANGNDHPGAEEILAEAIEFARPRIDRIAQAVL